METETTYEFIHRANIERYQLMLQTCLGPEERRFIELRLVEEQAALQQLTRNVAPKAKSIHSV